MSGRPKLEAFLRGPERNLWIEREAGLKVYLRKSRRDEYGRLTSLDTATFATIEVSNVIAYKMGKGCFTAFITWLEMHYSSIYIENVLETRFLNFFIRRGYTICSPRDQYPPCLIWTRKI